MKTIVNEVNWERLLETTRDFLSIRTLKAKLDYLTVMHTSADSFQELLSQADYYIPSLRVDKFEYETNAHWKDRQELIHFTIYLQRCLLKMERFANTQIAKRNNYGQILTNKNRKYIK